MNKQEFIANAKELLDKGFNVIPLFGHNDLGVEESKRGKAPRINWLPYQHIKATMKEIENWSCLSNEMNLGIVCGKTSNIIVVDADNETAIKTLDELNLPETLTVRTAKGKHLYFKYFESDVINNAVRFYDGIDIRTQGGFVVAPGSLHRLGTTYEFINNAPIIEMPENLIAFIKDNIEKKSKKSAEKGAKLVETLKEGNRNDTLFRVACSMRAIGIDENIIKYAIEKQNNMLSSPLEENELSTLLNSVFRYESGRQIRGLTDYDNGLRMKDLYENILCFIPERKKWASYNGNRWVLDDTRGIAVEKFIGMADAIVTEVPEPKNEEETNAYEERVKFSKSCRNLQRINNGLDITKGLLGVSELEFDKNEWLLSVKNGTLNLKTGELQTPKATDYILCRSNVSYDKEAQCPRWNAFIDEIFGDDAELKGYIQRAVGYTLTGSNREKAFFILYGKGDNGKSVFLNTIGYLLGDFYKKASFDTFTTKGKNKSVRNDLAGLKGARIVVASETEEGERLDESLIKDITGGEPINCRFLFGEDFTYNPTFKMWFSTNHLPTIRDDSNGMWNRVKTIPFLATIPKDKQDIQLTDKLREEASGILNWCLKGLQMYMEDGLKEATSIVKAVEVYREENDTFGAFLREWLVPCDTGRISRQEIYTEFNMWCEKTGSYPKGMSNRKLFKKLRDRGVVEQKVHGARVFTGYKIRTTDTQDTKYIEGNVIAHEF